MKPTHLATCIISIATACAVCASIHYATAARSGNITIQKMKAEIGGLNAKLKTATDDNREEISTLKTTASRFQANLQDMTNQLLAASNVIHGYEVAQAEDRKNKAAKEAARNDEYLNSVPSPIVSGIALVFPKIVGIYGQTLETNAVFVQQIGRLLVFRPEGRVAVSYDVDNLHPLMLEYLGINADGAKLLQNKLNAAWAAKEQSDRLNAAASAQVDLASIHQQQQMALEQQKVDAASRAAYASQQQAAADKAKADAALINAQKPQQSINVIQQSQQNQSVYR